MSQQQLAFDMTPATPAGHIDPQPQATQPVEKQPKDLAHGETMWMGNYEVRNFHGFHQSREGGVGKWKFYVSGFDGTVSGQAGRCTVLRIDGGREEHVSIDAQDRILIRGERYGRAHWNH